METQVPSPEATPSVLGSPTSFQVHRARFQEQGCSKTVSHPEFSLVLLSIHRPSSVFIVSSFKSFLQVGGGINK